MNKIKIYISRQYNWYAKNLQKIILVVGLHIFLSYSLKLPYVNIFASLFSSLSYFFDWIAILILFKPKKELILKIGILLFAVSYIFALIKLNFVIETLGEISFLMIGTYIILVIKEIKD